MIGALFVRAAEALDTPEAHAAYSQGFRALHRFLLVMASDEANDLFKNLSDLTSKVARLGNAPETTVAVAQFVAQICQALEEEHATYVRERTEMYAPFEEGGDDDLKREKMAAQGNYGVVGDNGLGERFEFDEDLVLGTRGGSADEDEDKAVDTSDKPDIEPVPGGREGELPSWDADRWTEIKTGRGSPHKEDRFVGLFLNQMQLQLAKQQESEHKRKEKDQHHAMLCVLSFVFFITWTMFAFYGMIAAVHHLGSFLLY